jgi:hypothetical protein
MTLIPPQTIDDKVNETFLRWYNLSEFYSNEYTKRTVYFKPMVSQRVNDDTIKLYGKRFMLESQSDVNTKSITLEDKHELVIPYSRFEEYFTEENVLPAIRVYETMCDSLKKYPDIWFERTTVEESVK